MPSRRQRHCISPPRPDGPAEAGGESPCHSSAYRRNYHHLSTIIHTFIMILKVCYPSQTLNEMNDRAFSFINPHLDARPLNSDLCVSVCDLPFHQHTVRLCCYMPRS